MDKTIFSSIFLVTKVSSSAPYAMQLAIWEKKKTKKKTLLENVRECAWSDHIKDDC